VRAARDQVAQGGEGLSCAQWAALWGRTGRLGWSARCAGRARETGLWRARAVHPEVGSCFSAVKKNTGTDAGCCGENPAGQRASLHFMVRLCLVFRSSPMKNDLIDAMMRDGADFVFGPASFLSTGERNEVLEPEGFEQM